MFRLIIVSMIAILNIVFQSTIVQQMAIGGITINLLMISVVSYALIRGKLEGAIFGLAIGLLQDVYFGNVIGFYGLVYMYFGFFAGYLNKTLYRDNLLIPVTVISLSELIYNLFIYIITYLFRGRTDFLFYFRNIILPELIYTAVLAIFIYKLYLYVNQRLDRAARKKEDRNKV